MSEFFTANITYKGLEDKGLTIQIIDQDKKKWTIWKNDYKDKTMESEPYRAFQNFKLGDSFGVSYGEKEESFTGKDGKTVNFTRKTIYSIMPTLAAPVSAPKKQLVEKPVTETRYEPAPDNDVVGKCQTLFLQAYLQSGKSFSEAKLQVTQARQLAELVVYGTTQAQPEEVPVAEYAGEVDSDQIPF